MVQLEQANTGQVWRLLSFDKKTPVHSPTPFFQISASAPWRAHTPCMETPALFTLSAQSVNLRMQKGNHASHEHVASMQMLPKLMTLLAPALSLNMTEMHSQRSLALMEFGFDGLENL